jgi:DNA-binding response OmpR family regulator
MYEKILIIDDDTKLNHLLKTYLSKYNYKVSSITQPDEALKQLRVSLPDLIILDIMLPGMDGFEVCREIRKHHSVPVIMLTARGEVSDRVVGLELGADDYLPKPFEPRELVARIQSVLRRSTRQPVLERRQFGALVIDSQKRTAFLEGKDLDLTTNEFAMLSLFASNPGVVLNRDRIIEQTRGLDWDAFDRSIDVLISRLRQKLGDDPKNPNYIKTVWGAGYMFIARESEGD